MVFIVEGKEYRALGKDCRAVSEVIGQVLMDAVVVLAFSSIALTVFSDEGAMRPPHVPRTDLQESINGERDSVQIFHSGGEAIDLKDIKIILTVDGDQEEFDISDPAVKVYDPKGKNLSSGDVFTLGDCIEIKPGNRIDIKNGNDINLYFVHTASKQVIKKAML